MFSPQTSGAAGVKVNVGVGFTVAITSVLTWDSQLHLEQLHNDV
jgi:hypothetical protein